MCRVHRSTEALLGLAALAGAKQASQRERVNAGDGGANRVNRVCHRGVCGVFGCSFRVLFGTKNHEKPYGDTEWDL